MNSERKVSLMLYTVKEIASLSKVTIKTLHHYHKIGLLLPSEISEAGYRLYGTKELERLQHILFYRELEFPLEKIKELLNAEPERITILSQQEDLLLARKQRLETIIQTLRNSVNYEKRGETMEKQDMFVGFTHEDEWKEAMSDQNQYLKQEYEVDLLDSVQINVQDMNEQAAEAADFMKDIACALKEGVKHNDEKTKQFIGNHLDFMNKHGHPITAADFAAQTHFFLNDDFHLRMLEDQQTGLAYYLSTAAQSFAADCE